MARPPATQSQHVHGSVVSLQRPCPAVTAVAAAAVRLQLRSVKTQIHLQTWQLLLDPDTSCRRSCNQSERFLMRYLNTTPVLPWTVYQLFFFSSSVSIFRRRCVISFTLAKQCASTVLFWWIFCTILLCSILQSFPVVLLPVSHKLHDHTLQPCSSFGLVINDLQIGRTLRLPVVITTARSYNSRLCFHHCRCCGHWLHIPMLKLAFYTAIFQFCVCFVVCLILLCLCC